MNQIPVQTTPSDADQFDLQPWVGRRCRWITVWTAVGLILLATSIVTGIKLVGLREWVFAPVCLFLSIMCFDPILFRWRAYRWQHHSVTWSDEAIQVKSYDDVVAEARWESVDSIRWSQAPRELTDMSLLELRAADGTVLLSFPVPLRFVPMQPEEPLNDLKVAEVRSGERLLEAVRSRVDNREDFGVDFDVDVVAWSWRGHVPAFAILGSLVYLMAPCYLYFGAFEPSVFGFPDSSGGRFALIFGLQCCSFPTYAWNSGHRATGSSLWASERASAWREGYQGNLLPPGSSDFALSPLHVTAVRRIPEGPVLPLLIVAACLFCSVLSAVLVFAFAKHWYVGFAFVLAGGWFLYKFRQKAALRQSLARILDNIGDQVEFRTDGTLSVTKPSGERLEFSSITETWVDGWPGVVEFVCPSGTYITALPMLEPVGVPMEEQDA